jgi:hypothetical protein
LFVFLLSSAEKVFRYIFVRPLHSLPLTASLFWLSINNLRSAKGKKDQEPVLTYDKSVFPNSQIPTWSKSYDFWIYSCNASVAVD